jgi:hypothetical protein
MNGVDMIQVPRVGASAKNAADIRMTVDAVETVVAHPAVEVFVLVTGDSDYSPLARRLREERGRGGRPRPAGRCSGRLGFSTRFTASWWPYDSLRFHSRGLP